MIFLDREMCIVKYFNRNFIMIVYVVIGVLIKEMLIKEDVVKF